MHMYIPGAASVHGFFLKSGQSTTSISTFEKFFAKPALSTKIMIKDKLMQATDSITTSGGSRPWAKGGGLDLLALSAIFPLVISSFFTQNKGGPPPLDPPLTTVVAEGVCLVYQVIDA